MIFGPRPNPVADELRAQLSVERDRNDALLRQIVELRREGFNPPPPQVEAGQVDGLPHEVMVAIDARGLTRQARERLMQQARRMLAEGDAEQVAERILEGEEFQW